MVLGGPFIQMMAGQESVKESTRLIVHGGPPHGSEHGWPLDSSTCPWPVYVTWASHSMVTGSERKHLESECSETKAEPASLPLF